MSKLSGACLCGSVRYEISGDVQSFFHCHCSRCRKATGTGHASNVILKPDSAAFTQGESLISSYPVPGAKRFRTVFCSNCGSPLPRIAPDLSIAVVPAGTLDDASDLQVTDRIFWGSRSAWSCDSGSLPAWDEYPVR
ncbi:MAG: GFA family protein [Gammaproteobacteria bacterium]|nr:GFA family protein [Gammaproteobacteria bacterium]MDH4315626.1 GFA family protein [Gammaproteobacteria bacterium]MDH5213409.1 GFA family protein [Gammaproteobacteria bacterium]